MKMTERAKEIVREPTKQSEWVVVVYAIKIARIYNIKYILFECRPGQPRSVCLFSAREVENRFVDTYTQLH